MSWVERWVLSLLVTYPQTTTGSYWSVTISADQIVPPRILYWWNHALSVLPFNYFFLQYSYPDFTSVVWIDGSFFHGWVLHKWLMVWIHQALLIRAPFWWTPEFFPFSNYPIWSCYGMTVSQLYKDICLHVFCKKNGCAISWLYV